MTFWLIATPYVHYLFFIFFVDVLLDIGKIFLHRTTQLTEPFKLH
jgi:hypothetical protein